MRKEAILSIGVAAAAFTPTPAKAEEPKTQVAKRGPADTAPSEDVAKAQWQSKQPESIWAVQTDQRNLVVSAFAGSTLGLNFNCPPGYSAEAAEGQEDQFTPQGDGANSYRLSLKVPMDTTRRHVDWILCRNPDDNQIWLSVGTIPVDPAAPNTPPLPDGVKIPEQIEAIPVAPAPMPKAKVRKPRAAKSEKTKSVEKAEAKPAKPTTKDEAPVIARVEAVPARPSVHETTANGVVAQKSAQTGGLKKTLRVWLDSSAAADVSTGDPQLAAGVGLGLRLKNPNSPNGLDLGLHYAERFDSVRAHADNPNVTVNPTIEGREITGRAGWVRDLISKNSAKLRYLLGASLGLRQHDQKTVTEGTVHAENGLTAKADTGFELAIPVGAQKRNEIGFQLTAIGGLNHATSGSQRSGSVVSIDGGAQLGVTGNFDL